LGKLNHWIDMTFKDSSTQFQIIEVSLLDPDPNHARQNVNEESIKGLVTGAAPGCF
jgi:hypothetical protein